VSTIRGAIIQLIGTIKRDTGKATLFVVDENEHGDIVDLTVSPSAFTTGIWFPNSQIKETDPGSEYDTITVTAWIAGQKGIEV
jgi:hypothetical protein